MDRTGPSGDYVSPRPETQPSTTLPAVALTLGIVSIPAITGVILGAVVLGLGAVAVGYVALARIRRGAARRRGMAIAGIVTGVIGVSGSVTAFAVLPLVFGA